MNRSAICSKCGGTDTYYHTEWDGYARLRCRTCRGVQNLRHARKPPGAASEAECLHLLDLLHIYLLQGTRWVKADTLLEFVNRASRAKDHKRKFGRVLATAKRLGVRYEVRVERPLPGELNRSDTTAFYCFPYAVDDRVYVEEILDEREAHKILKARKWK